LVRDTLGRVTLIAAQSDADAERFARLGAPAGRIHVIGNLKFDAALPEDVATLGLALRKALGRGRPVWVAGSTHEGEEEMLLTAHAALRKSVPSALLVLVPRHPPRFGAVEALLRQRGEVYVTRRGGGLVGAETGVLLVDTLGELVAFYAAADAAFVGGSLVPIGGHNLLEPAALGKPILTGPHTQNAAAIAQSLIDAGAATVVDDAAAIESRLRTCLLNPRAARTAGAAGLGVVATSGGALERLLALIEPHLAGRSPT
jgi:3-deoxy-D-manno-octulosonic-acid transferase